MTFLRLMMMETQVVRITDLINPNFYPVWRTKKPHVILSGGRSSMKSSVISLKLVADFLNDYQGNVITSEEHTSELQSRPHLVGRLLLEKKNQETHSSRY